MFCTRLALRTGTVLYLKVPVLQRSSGSGSVRPSDLEHYG
eukprot:COSAG04_NODE_3104_length_3168_cov_2.158684_5_plen_39_part_01